MINPIVIYILVGLAGGIAVGLQGPLSSIISGRLGPMESSFIVHFGGALAALLVLALMGGGSLGRWREAPWYTLGAGALGLVLISAISYLIPRIGVAPSIVLIVAGQIVLGAVLDHFGWLGASVRPFDGTRLLGLAVVFAGVWLTIR